MRELDRLEEDAAGMGVALSAEEVERIRSFALLLEERGVALGLIAPRDRSRLYRRHVLDSLRAAVLVSADDRLAYDLGSGGGLPGIVLAAACPWCRFVLVEPRRRRAAFLELAIECLGLTNAEVEPRRAEELSEPADLATARAFAPLPEAWRLAAPLLRTGGRLVYFAGASLDRSAVEAAASEPAAEVHLRPVLASWPPLVIMARK